MNEEDFRRYLEKASTAPLLSKSQEHELALANQRGDPDARERLLTANMRLVVSVARRYEGRGLALSTLVSVGHSGLERALDGFDVAKGYRLSTFATWWIRQAMTRAIADETGR